MLKSKMFGEKLLEKWLKNVLFYGERRCRFEIRRLKSRYESFLKKGVENVKTPYFFDAAKNAFGSTE